MTTEEIDLHRQLFELERRWAQTIMATAKGSEERQRAYAQAYAEVHEFIAVHFPQQGENRRSLFAARQQMLNRIVPGTTSIKFLDVGCDQGDLLLQMHDLGWQVHGVDVNPVAVAGLRQKFTDRQLPPERVYLGELQDVSENNFDVLYHSDVLEHLHPDSVPEFCALCYEKLTPNGILIMFTPPRLRGPSDVSKYFLRKGTPAQGLHLKEYTLRDLHDLLSPLGFELRSLSPFSPETMQPTRQWFRLKLLIESILTRLQPLAPELIAKIVNRLRFMPLVCVKSSP